jgi:very-short-patch-repair endonuclease
MSYSRNRTLLGKARSLRTNMTKEERHLWYDFLKLLPVMVHRQKVIGRYIADFYVAAAKLVIELDGSQHYEDPTYDISRDAYLKEQGLRVLRIPNNAIKDNFSGVCEEILRHITPGETEETL